MQYLGVAVLGIAVLGTAVLGAAVLGTAVLHPHTRLLSTQHSLSPLSPQKHLNPKSRMAHHGCQATCNTLVWPCWAS
jgi:hypothetical protein